MNVAVALKAGHFLGSEEGICPHRVGFSFGINFRRV
jgi:hypothetical protein